MTIRNVLTWSIVLVLLAGGTTAAVMTRATWHPWLFPSQDDEADAADDAHAGGLKHIELSKQARDNINPKLDTITPRKEYARSLRLPGTIVPRPGQTQVKISMPITSVVTAIHAFPGQTVKPGDKLFTVHMHYHEIQQTQAELYKAAQELKINAEEQERLRHPAGIGAIPESELLDLEYKNRRLKVALYALQENLQLHGFTKPQIEQIQQGKFIDERTIVVPDVEGAHPNGDKTLAGNGHNKDTPVYEVGHLHVKIGDQVQAGKEMCELANHKLLYIEARAFPSEIPVLQEAIKKPKEIEAEVLDLSGHQWEKVTQPLHILYVDQHIDPASQSAGVYLRLQNEDQHRYYTDNKTYILWKYRPGQRVYINVPIKKFKNVLVLPNAAVVQDGAENYVFRENGKVLEQQPVHVLYRDQKNTVIANDGSILPNVDYIAHNGAAQIHRAIKMESEGGGGGGHHHHHH